MGTRRRTYFDRAMWMSVALSSLLLAAGGCDSSKSNLEHFSQAVSEFSKVLKEDRLIEATERGRYVARLKSSFDTIDASAIEQKKDLVPLYSEAKELSESFSDFDSDPHNASLRLIRQLYPGDWDDDDKVRGHVIRQLWIEKCDSFLVKCETAGLKTDI